MQAGGEDRGLLRLAVRPHAAKDLDFTGLALGQEQIAVGGGADHPRVVEAGGVQFHLEAPGRGGPGVRGASDNVGAIVHRLVRRGSGQIGDSQVAADAGRFVQRVSESGLAGEDGALRVFLGLRFSGLSRARAERQGNMASAKIKAGILKEQFMKPLGETELEITAGEREACRSAQLRTIISDRKNRSRRERDRLCV